MLHAPRHIFDDLIIIIIIQINKAVNRDICSGAAADYMSGKSGSSSPGSDLQDDKKKPDPATKKKNLPVKKTKPDSTSENQPDPQPCMSG